MTMVEMLRDKLADTHLIEDQRLEIAELEAEIDQLRDELSRARQWRAMLEWITGRR